MGRFMEENESVFSSRSTSPNFEQTNHQDNNQSNSTTNGDTPDDNDAAKNGDEESSEKHEQRNLNFPIFGKEKETFFDSEYNVNFNNKGTTNNTTSTASEVEWRRRTSPVSVVSTN